MFLQILRHFAFNCSVKHNISKKVGICTFLGLNLSEIRISVYFFPKTDPLGTDYGAVFLYFWMKSRASHSHEKAPQ